MKTNAIVNIITTWRCNGNYMTVKQLMFQAADGTQRCLIYYRTRNNGDATRARRFVPRGGRTPWLLHICTPWRLCVFSFEKMRLD